jgi:hypothetical protein
MVYFHIKNAYFISFYLKKPTVQLDSSKILSIYRYVIVLGKALSVQEKKFLVQFKIRSEQQYRPGMSPKYRKAIFHFVNIVKCKEF